MAVAVAVAMAMAVSLAIAVAVAVAVAMAVAVAVAAAVAAAMAAAALAVAAPSPVWAPSNRGVSRCLGTPAMEEEEGAPRPPTTHRCKRARGGESPGHREAINRSWRRRPPCHGGWRRRASRARSQPRKGPSNERWRAPGGNATVCLASGRRCYPLSSVRRYWISSPCVFRRPQVNSFKRTASLRRAATGITRQDLCVTADVWCVTARRDPAHTSQPTTDHSKPPPPAPSFRLPARSKLWHAIAGKCDARKRRCT